MSNRATDKAQTGKPDRGKNSPFKKKLLKAGHKPGFSFKRDVI